MASATANKNIRMYPFGMRSGSHWGLLFFMSNVVLTAQSISNEIKAYFNSVLTLTKSGKKFPVDLDDVWSACYSDKYDAIKELTEANQFYEKKDYKIVHYRNKKRLGLSREI